MKPGLKQVVRIAAVSVAAFSRLFVCPNLWASSVNTSFPVSVTVNSKCALNVANMNFGTLATVKGTETASSYVSVVCTKGSTIFLSFTPVYSATNTTRNSTMTSAAGGKINFKMTLQGSFGILNGGQTGYTYIDGQLAATPGAVTGFYQSLETLYINY